MSDFGKFLAEKLKRINPNNLPVEVGVAWYTRDSYLRCLALFCDKADRPRTYKEWSALAERREKELRDQGMRIVRIIIDPVALQSWCHNNGFHHINTNALGQFVNCKVHERSIQESKKTT
jgi:hypothetical protein